MNAYEKHEADMKAEFAKALQRDPESNVDPRLAHLPDRLVASYYIARSFFADRYEFFRASNHLFLRVCEEDRELQKELYNEAHSKTSMERLLDAGDLRALRDVWDELKLQISIVRSEQRKIEEQLKGQPYKKDDPRLSYLPRQMIELFNRGFELSEERPMTLGRVRAFGALEDAVSDEILLDNDNLFRAWDEISRKVWRLRQESPNNRSTPRKKADKTKPPIVVTPKPSTIPVSRVDRAALLLPANTDERFQQILLLSNPATDATDAEWLNILGLAYKNPSHSHYDSGKAHELFLSSANLQFGPAAYNLAIGWQRGLFGNIDLERARFWYAKGYEYGHGCAGAILAEMMFQDPRFSTDNKFYSAAIEVLQRSENMHGLVPPYMMANLLADSDDPASLNGAIARYEFIAASDADVPPRAYARACLAFRHFLGLGVQLNYKKSLEYLSATNVDDQQSSVRYVLENMKRRLRFIIENTPQSHDDQEARHLIQRYETLLKSNTHPEATNSFLLSLASDAKITSNLNDVFWARTTLAELENSVFASWWNSAAQTIQRRVLGATRDELHESTNDFGYIYNERNISGYLIPATSIDPQRPVADDFYQRSQAPVSGLGVLRVLSTTSSGQIILQCDQPTSPANTFITGEDVSVALALAFRESEPIMPSLSIEDINSENASLPRFFIERKEWNPAWVGHTQLGKTLYAADYWMGRILWNQSRFYTIDRTLDPLANAILQKLALAGGQADGNYARAMIQPKAIIRTWTGSVQGGLSCQIHSAAIGVLGANIVVHADGTEDRSRNVNDDKYSAGRAANIFTKHYDDIAKVWPVFERTRQLNVLLSLLRELREKGFKPSATLQRTIDATYRRFIDRPVTPLHQQLVCKI